MAKEGNVELADGTVEEEDTAVVASKVTMLHLVNVCSFTPYFGHFRKLRKNNNNIQSVLRATVRLSKLLEWWKMMMGENTDVSIRLCYSSNTGHLSSYANRIENSFGVKYMFYCDICSIWEVIRFYHWLS